jgi:hypothetical protein
MLGLTDIAKEAAPHIGPAEEHPFGFFDGATTARVHGMHATLVGDWDAAAGHFAMARRQVEQTRTTFEPPFIDLWEGKMLASRGEPAGRDRAAALIATALEGFERIGLPLHAEMAEEARKAL